MAIKVNPRCFFDLERRDGEKLGRIVFELFGDILPKTAERFRCRCTGEISEFTDGRVESFRESVLHRTGPGFMIRCEESNISDGSEGHEFSSETLRHDKPFLLSMTPTSTVFITLQPAPDFDSTHFVFGRVVGGHGVLEALDQLTATEKETSGNKVVEVVVARCGELELKLPKDVMETSESESESDSSYERRKERKKRKKEEKERKKKEKRERKRKKLEENNAKRSEASVSGSDKLGSEKQRYALPPGTEFRQVYGLHDDRLFSERYRNEHRQRRESGNERPPVRVDRRARSPGRGGDSYVPAYRQETETRSRTRRPRSRERRHEERQYKGRGSMRYKTPPPERK